jgi:hypothetical protein
VEVSQNHFDSYHLVKQVPRAAPVLAPPPPPHLVCRRAWVDHAVRGDRVGERVGPVGPTALPGRLGQAEPKAVGQEPAQHCASDFEFVFFFLIISEIGASF